MAWHATPELRWLSKINGLEVGTAVCVPALADWVPRLQQKWVEVRYTETNLPPDEEWRDVPTVRDA